MASSKIELFDPVLQDAALHFKALSHPARLSILQYLAESKVCITGDISEFLPLGRTTVNQHLKELRKLDLIQGTVEGTKRNYCLNPGKIRELRNILEGYLGEICCREDHSS